MKKLLLILVSALFIISCISISFAADVPVSKNPTFSFASDTCSQGPTFHGSPNGIYCYDTKVDLMFDLNNDNEAGLVTFSALMKSGTMLIYDHNVVEIGKYQFVHIWKVSAEIFFSHRNAPDYTPLLEIYFKEGLLTSWSSSPMSIGKTMTLQDSERVDPSIYMFPRPLLNAIGILPECLYQYEDLAFTFTNIRPLKDPANFVNIDENGHFLDEWISEGSFSASGSLEKPLL